MESNITLTAYELTVLKYVAWSIRTEEACWYDIQDMVSDCKLSSKQIRAVVTDLKNKGFVTVHSGEIFMSDLANDYAEKHIFNE